MATQIGIFAKHWTPGRVKTRLAADIGDEHAARLAKRFIETLIHRLAGAAEQRVIGFSPPSEREAFSMLAGDGWQTRPQSQGDLGERMANYFHTAFNSGAERVVLLGADSPNLPLATVHLAFEALKSAKLVLAPTDDGGYCLVGARGGPPPIFQAMPWSEPGLWRATVQRLESLGWIEGRDWRALPSWYDVDTLADLNRLVADLQGPAGAPDPDLNRLADELSRVLDSATP